MSWAGGSVPMTKALGIQLLPQFLLVVTEIDSGQVNSLAGHAGSQNQWKANAQNIENGHKQTNEQTQGTLEAKE